MDKLFKAHSLIISSRRRAYLFGLVVVIITGVLSRTGHTGTLLIDKYLGDTLYAAMAYLFLSLFWDSRSPLEKAVMITLLMLIIEGFQLTLIPLAFRLSDNPILRMLSVLLGTKFAWLDIVAYGVGIAAIYIIDRVYLTELRIGN